MGCERRRKSEREEDAIKMGRDGLGLDGQRSRCVLVSSTVGNGKGDADTRRDVDSPCGSGVLRVEGDNGERVLVERTLRAAQTREDGDQPAILRRKKEREEDSLLQVEGEISQRKDVGQLDCKKREGKGTHGADVVRRRPTRPGDPFVVTGLEGGGRRVDLDLSGDQGRRAEGEGEGEERARAEHDGQELVGDGGKKNRALALALPFLKLIASSDAQLAEAGGGGSPSAWSCTVMRLVRPLNSAPGVIREVSAVGQHKEEGRERRRGDIDTVIEQGRREKEMEGEGKGACMCWYEDGMERRRPRSIASSAQETGGASPTRVSTLLDFERRANLGGINNEVVPERIDRLSLLLLEAVRAILLLLVL